jgi:hypothetical protein
VPTAELEAKSETSRTDFTGRFEAFSIRCKIRGIGDPTENYVTLSAIEYPLGEGSFLLLFDKPSAKDEKNVIVVPGNFLFQ